MNVPPIGKLCFRPKNSKQSSADSVEAKLVEMKQYYDMKILQMQAHHQSEIKRLEDVITSVQHSFINLQAHLIPPPDTLTNLTPHQLSNQHQSSFRRQHSRDYAQSYSPQVKEHQTPPTQTQFSQQPP